MQAEAIAVRQYCKKCRTLRKGATCWKCGGDTIVPAVEWHELKMPPVDRIRALAKEVGYAIGVHGSLERDLDLIAAPWSDEAVDAHVLILHIKNGLGAALGSVCNKPLGRCAATIQIDGWYKAIDISVCPKRVNAGPQS